MRKFRLGFGLIAIVGWAFSANAGSVTQTYDIDETYGATGTTVTKGLLPDFPSDTVSGTLTIAFSTPNSTFGKTDIPASTTTIHMANLQVTGKGSAMGLFRDWTVTGSVKAQANGSTMCHVGANGVIAGSCMADFHVTTKAHCSGADCDVAPGDWHTTGSKSASITHTQMWKAVSVHLGKATFTHKAGSTHYLKSFQATLVPTSDLTHTSGSNSYGHLASSDKGYHTFHFAGKLISSGS